MVRFYKDKKGKVRWKINAVNSKIVAASSQGFKDKYSARKNLQSLYKSLTLSVTSFMKK